jgi:hypothetical protein
MAKRSLPAPDRLCELLDYNSATGALIWKPRTGKWSSRWNRRYAGQRAGTITADGSIVVKVFDQNIPAHRLAWAMCVGAWPARVWHRNGAKTDNRAKNLVGRMEWRTLEA